MIVLEVLEEYVSQDLQFQSGHNMQFDVFVPKYNLAFEYQGEQHYQDIYSVGNSWLISQRDNEKRIASISNNITLIEIPYWWDFTKESLQATIHQHRPDIAEKPTKGDPISQEPPEPSKKCEFLC